MLTRYEDVMLLAVWIYASITIVMVSVNYIDNRMIPIIIGDKTPRRIDLILMVLNLPFTLIVYIMQWFDIYGPHHRVMNWLNTEIKRKK